MNRSGVAASAHGVRPAARTRPGPPSRLQIWWICLALFASALALRLVGVDWHGSHPDEDIGGPARILTGNFHAGSLYYPPLLTYLVAIAYVPLFVVGRIAGWWASAADFRAAYFAEPDAFFVTARTVVAACAATAAPIAFLLARHAGLATWRAAMVGIVLVVLPGGIFWAHIAKSDSGLGPCFLLVTLAAFRLVEQPLSWTRALLLGFSIALSVSFKHSAIFFVGPLLLVVLLFSLRGPDALGVTVKAWARVGILAVLFWLPMNVGILLDPQGFIDAQAVQSQMSRRAASLSVTADAWLRAIGDAQTNMPPPVLVAVAAAIVLAVLGPARLRLRPILAALVIAWLVATLVICAITGSRQPSHLWIPYATVAAAAGAIAGAHLTESAAAPFRASGYAVLAFLVAVSVYLSVPVLQQATTTPINSKVADVIRQAAPPGAKIVSNLDLSRSLPVSAEGDRMMRARHERLAAKYHLTLPPSDRPFGGKPDGYVVIGYPFVIGGLEGYQPSDVATVLPYAWPIQSEEWQLDSFLSRGFHLFVVQDPELLNHPVATYRDFFREIDRSCQRLARIAGARPLFDELDTSVYRCP